MPRLLFEKKGNAVWISHLDLMRLFQRGFKRAGLPLTHTQGFNPRPSVSIALPMSVGVESVCELLDFELEGDGYDLVEICRKLNDTLCDGVKVLTVYEGGRKLKELSLMDCCVTLEYDDGIPQGAEDSLRELFSRESVTVEKKNKNGVTQQNIIPMIHSMEISGTDNNTINLLCRICCQNPTLNPMQICAAIERYLPDVKPDFSKCARMEIFDENNQIFR
jgi:radical SAM-linked protein